MIKKFFTYLGFENSTLDEVQLIRLMLLLGREGYCLTYPTTLEELVNRVLEVYIYNFERGGFKHITEQEIIEELSK